MAQDILKEKIPVAHLSTSYLNEYHKKLLRSASSNAFYSMTSLVQLVSCGIIICSPQRLLFSSIIYTVYAGVSGYSLMHYLKSSVADIHRSRELDSQLKGASEINIGDINISPNMDYAKAENIMKLELAMSSFIEVLHKKSKIKNDRGELARLEKSEGYLKQFILKSYQSKSLSPDDDYLGLLNMFLEAVYNVDASWWVKLYSTAAAVSAVITGVYFYYATSPLHLSSAFGRGLFYLGGTAKYSYKAYETFRDSGEVTYQLSDEDMARKRFSKLFEARAKDLSIPNSELEGFKKEAESKFTDMIKNNQQQPPSAGLNI